MSDRQVEAAAALIRAGQLVGFPTETVYGVGANALDPAAIDRIYEAKGRPRGSPLIVHIGTIAMARQLVREWPENAARLAELFWPGPLTLVLPKSHLVPEGVTGGLDTVGIRMPNHSIALELIRAAGVPIAAPSANRFSQLSPTTSDHVRAGLGDSVAMVLEGGPAHVGIESTVLSLAGLHAVLLRPGMISQSQLEAVIGPIRLPAQDLSTPHPSPGMHPKHYSPKTHLVIVAPGSLPAGRGACLCITRNAGSAHDVQMPADPYAYASRLYETLHELDGLGFDWIAVERPPSDILWAGILDRLTRAAVE